MTSRIQLLTIIGAIGFLAFIFELIRQRRLREQYSLLWLSAGLFLLAFSLKRDLIRLVGDAMGVAYAPAALLLIVTLFFMVILLHFSTIVSDLSDRNRKLTQRLALLQHELERKGSIAAPGSLRPPPTTTADDTPGAG